VDKNPIVLVQNMFVNDRRMHEIEFSIKWNRKNEYINDFLFMFEDDSDENTNGKTWNFLHECFHGNKLIGSISACLRRGHKWERPTYDQIFEECNKTFTNGEIIILANNDIFFDKTLEHVKNFNKWDDCVMALTRWEFDGQKQSHYLNWDYSQDVWIWKSPLNIEGIEADFPLGMQGCDNRIAYELGKNYNVINPCKTIRCHHFHTTQYRTYRAGDLSQTVPEPHVRVKHIELGEKYYDKRL
jgi:hypothetical protein